ncbi:MAG: hypothetical protein Q8L65_12845, partial [Burkholderiales bacterium]|nr:hypothetical protein [Burkholderiales bacterium]
PTAPRLLFDGYGRKPDPGVRRGDMESGPAKQLKTKARVLHTRPVQYLLTSKTDLDAFETWFESTINMGADWFDWTDPYDNTVKTARIVGGQIDLQPQRKMLDRWVATFQIETWGR